MPTYCPKANPIKQAFGDGHDKRTRNHQPILKVIFQPLKIKIDDLQHPAIHALLNEHLKNMHELSPPESVHAINLENLRVPDITFWAAWENDLLLGCGALKEIDEKHGEVKSMRTPKGGLTLFEKTQPLYDSLESLNLYALTSATTMRHNWAAHIIEEVCV